MGTTKNTKDIVDTLQELQQLLKPVERVSDLQAEGWVTRMQVAELMKVTGDTAARHMNKLVAEGQAETRKGRTDSGQVVSVFSILK